MKPSKQRVPPLSVKNLLRRCTKAGNCLLWKGWTVNGYPYVHDPERYAAGVSPLVRASRALWNLQHPDQPLTANQWISTKCGNRMCMACLYVREKGGLKGETSVKKTVAARNNGRACSTAPAIVTQVLAAKREGVDADTVVARLGVSKSTVYRIWRGSGPAPLPQSSIFNLGGSL